MPQPGGRVNSRIVLIVLHLDASGDFFVPGIDDLGTEWVLFRESLADWSVTCMHVNVRSTGIPVLPASAYESLAREDSTERG